MHIRILITLTSILFIIIHIFNPELKIDIITVILIIIAFIPWTTNLFEAVEFPGGFKFTMRKLEEAGIKGEEIGLIESELSTKDEKIYSFQIISEQDPNLALAGLRIEIEKRIKAIAEKLDISTNMQGIIRILNILFKKEHISNAEYYLLVDLVKLLNEAVHGAKLTNDSYAWALNYGPRLLKGLDRRIQELS